MVISLPDEYVRDVLSRAQSAMSDGVVNVVIAFAKSFEIIRFDSSIRTDTDLVIGADASMGMLGLRMREHPGKSIRVMIDSGEELEIPAPIGMAYA